MSTNDEREKERGMAVCNGRSSVLEGKGIYTPCACIWRKRRFFMNWRRTGILGLCWGLLSSPVVYAAPLTLADLMRPLEYLDFSETYNHYSGVIDLFIYALLFIGVARVSLERRYPGRPGTVLSVGVGLSLAVGMVIAEHQFGFSLRSFGSVAALVLLLVFGVFVFQFLHGSGMSRLHALALAYSGIFLVLLAVAPEIITWLGETAPIFVLLLVFLLALSLFSIVSGFWPFSNQRRLIDQGYRQAVASDPMRRWDEGAAIREKRFLKHRLRPGAKQEASEARDLGRSISDLYDFIRRRGSRPEDIPSVLNGIRKTMAQAETLQRQAHDLRDLNARLKRFDVTLFSRKSRERLADVGPEAKAMLAKEMRDEVERLDVEKKADRIEEALERHVAELTRLLSEAAAAVQSGQPDRAAQIVKQAKASEEAIEKLADLMRRLEDYLLALTKNDIRIERKLISD